MTKAMGLALAGFGILLLWSAWANTNPWDELQAGLGVTDARRPLDGTRPTKR